MPSTSKIEQTIKTQPRLTAQQIQYTKMLEMSAPDFDEEVDRALEENPALEDSEEGILTPPDRNRGDDAPRYPGSNRSQDDDKWTPQIADAEETLYENLDRQLSELNLDPDVRGMAEYIIRNLEPSGYLYRSLKNIIDDYAILEGVDIDEETAEKALAAVKSLEPRGIGAAGLQESLLMQLESLPQSQTRDDAIAIVRDHFKVLVNRHNHVLISRLKANRERIDNALRLIRKQNPRPFNGFGEAAPSIVPDVELTKEDGFINLAICSRHPALAVSISYDTEAEKYAKKPQRKLSKEEKIIRDQRDRARDFVAMVKRRNETLLRVVHAIVDHQEEYFLTEDMRKLRPMMIKDIAKKTGDDFSVISRATNGKYIGTPWGIFPLRTFFSESKGGEDITRQAIEEAILEIVGGEDKRHPLSDRKIWEAMNAKGYNLQRRTVTKYRERLGIPNTRMRKES